ncbi:MAG: agmatine deiminase family protein [Planctomycetota bacterium]|nr:agmatine deiminase family protein [Planctomycetota bacterium]
MSVAREDANLLLSSTASACGLSMPAEWSPLRRVWLVRPHNEETWPGCLAQAQSEWDAWRDALSKVVEVVDCQEAGIETNDSWIRDFGPIFVRHPDGRIAGHDFRFNGWGDKYEVRDQDDGVPTHIRERWSIPMWKHDVVLEGGSIDVNGTGTVLTTTQCLDNANRGDRTRESMVQTLHDALGTSNVVWLPGGIRGDDTDGHIDDIARFVRRDAIVALRAPADHVDHSVLEANWNALANARDENQDPFDLIALPVPDPIYYDFPADRFGPGGRSMIPASHANFLIANGTVFVPVFGGASDDIACRVIESSMSNVRVVPIRARHLVVGLGSLHCLSCHEPS